MNYCGQTVLSLKYKVATLSPEKVLLQKLFHSWPVLPYVQFLIMKDIFLLWPRDRHLIGWLPGSSFFELPFKRRRFIFYTVRGVANLMRFKRNYRGSHIRTGQTKTNQKRQKWTSHSFLARPYMRPCGSIKSHLVTSLWPFFVRWSQHPYNSCYAKNIIT